MAFPEDTLSVYNNPAGLTRLGRRYDAERGLFSPKREYRANNDFAPRRSPVCHRVTRKAVTITS